MIDLFDRLGDTLNDMISSHDNNNVGHVVEQTFAYGGLAADVANRTDPVGRDDSLSLGSILRDTSNAAGKAFNPGGGNIFGGSGSSYYSSPIGITAHLQSAFGNFFHGVSPDVGSTNKPTERPQPAKALQSENPTDFYSRWYNRLREFAQAQEVADRGQSQIRTR